MHAFNTCCFCSTCSFSCCCSCALQRTPPSCVDTSELSPSTPPPTCSGAASSLATIRDSSVSLYPSPSPPTPPPPVLGTSYFLTSLLRLLLLLAFPFPFPLSAPCLAPLAIPKKLKICLDLTSSQEKFLLYEHALRGSVRLYIGRASPDDVTGQQRFLLTTRPSESLICDLGVKRLQY